MSVFNTVWSAAQRMLLHTKIEQTRIERPPVFIIGHWRTGTTLLHELLTCDPQFAYATNYDCFVPHHFLLSKRFFAPFVGWLLPQRRPMDDMPLRPHLPQEDEFALCGLGASTPYLRMAFPNREVGDLDLLNFDSASPGKVARFRESLEYFFKALTYHYGGKQLVLKSPPHTGRIRLLSQWFPGAKFIHLSRDPFQVFGSTLRLWRSLDQVQGFQLVRYSDSQLHDFVMDSYARLYEGYFAQRDAVPAENLIELKFENLVAAPQAEVQKIYERLSLGDFNESVRGNITEYLDQRRDHRAKPTRLDEATQRQVRREWSKYFEAFGYQQPASQTAMV